MDTMTDIGEVYRNAIERMGEGVYFLYDPETGKSYDMEVKYETLGREVPRLYIREESSRVYVKSPDFTNYISGLELVGVVQLGIPYTKPNYIPLNFS